MPGGGQRAPNAGELLRSGASVVRRLPGLAFTTAKYLRHRKSVEHQFLDGTGPESLDRTAAAAPDPDRLWPGEAGQVLRRSNGHGSLYRRLYEVQVTGAGCGSQTLIDRLINDPDRASPDEFAHFEWVRPGGPGGLGAEFAVRLPGPWDGPVRVVERTPTSFRLATLVGHLEAGEIEFRCVGTPDRMSFTIESWTRGGDRLSAVLYERVPITREVQLHMWVHVCQHIAELAGGRREGPVRVTTWRWPHTDG